MIPFNHCNCSTVRGLICTNTSGLNIDDIAAVLKDPSRVPWQWEHVEIHGKFMNSYGLSMFPTKNVVIWGAVLHFQTNTCDNFKLKTTVYHIRCQGYCPPISGETINQYQYYWWSRIPMFPYIPHVSCLDSSLIPTFPLFFSWILGGSTGTGTGHGYPLLLSCQCHAAFGERSHQPLGTMTWWTAVLFSRVIWVKFGEAFFVVLMEE